MVNRVRRDHLTEVTVLLILTHMLMTVLQMIGRAAPSRLPTHGLVVPLTAVDDWWWAIMHGTSILLLSVALVMKKASTGVVGATLGTIIWWSWGVLDMLWSLDTRPPVSLVAPGLAIAIGFVSMVCTMMWSEYNI